MKTTTCKNCKHWFSISDLGGDFGNCIELCRDNLIATASIFPKQEDENITMLDVDSEFITGQDFMCIHYKRY